MMGADAFGTLPDALNGTEPDEQLPLAAFSEVVDSDGAAQTPNAILGSPTVMWFYPAASTGG